MRYITILGLLILFSCDTTDKKKLYIEDYDDLSNNEKKILAADTLHGDYLKYEGLTQDSLKIELLLDEPNRFSIIKTSKQDKVIKRTEIVGSGRWSKIMDDATLLKFYFRPNDFLEVLDSAANKGKAKMLLTDMAGFNPQLDTLWIYGVPCIKTKTNR
jgi:hypothetical protein